MPLPRWTSRALSPSVVVVHVEDGDGVTKPDGDSLFAEFDQLIERGRRAVVVLDLTHALPDAARRKRFADYTRSKRADAERLLIATAIVAPSAFHRGVVQAVMWLVQVDQVRMRVFATRAEAETWALARAMDLTQQPRR